MSSALEKIKHYCAYQERCHREVRTKLLSMKVYGNELENIIVTLIEEGFLNEERFAIQFVRGKFYHKKWGKIKIKYELKMRDISPYLIQHALREIDDKDYRNIIIKLATQKLLTIKNIKNKFEKTNTIKNYLAQKGFESNLILEVLEDVLK